jgi:N4-gp56 family major capsid protein
MVAPRILAGTGQGTSPVRPAFWGIINTYLIDDLEDCTGFKSTSSYPSQMGVEEAEWGLVKNVRFVTSSEGHRDTSQSPDQFKVPIIGQNAYGTVRHETGDVKSIFHDKKTAGGPLEQSSTMGWKTFDVTRILNDNFMHILVVTHSSSVDS